MKEKGQDVRGMPLAFELVTPIVTLSSLFEPSLLPHLFFLSPHSPPHVLESRVLGQGTMSSGWSEPFAGHHKGGGGSYCGLPNSTNVCVELGEALPNETHCLWGAVVRCWSLIPSCSPFPQLLPWLGARWPEQLWLCRWTAETGHSGILSTFAEDRGLVRTERRPSDFTFM